jgi:hypothetical protein
MDGVQLSELASKVDGNYPPQFQLLRSEMTPRPAMHVGYAWVHAADPVPYD